MSDVEKEDYSLEKVVDKRSAKNGKIEQQESPKKIYARREMPQQILRSLQFSMSKQENI